MKIFGYNKSNNSPIELIEPFELAEITVNASPFELRKIADFLNFTANNMEAKGDRFDHEHLADNYDCFSDSPHFVVFKSHE